MDTRMTHLVRADVPMVAAKVELHGAHDLRAHVLQTLQLLQRCLEGDRVSE